MISFICGNLKNTETSEYDKKETDLQIESYQWRERQYNDGEIRVQAIGYKRDYKNALFNKGIQSVLCNNCIWSVIFKIA